MNRNRFQKKVIDHTVAQLKQHQSVQQVSSCGVNLARADNWMTIAGMNYLKGGQVGPNHLEKCPQEHNGSKKNVYKTLCTRSFVTHLCLTHSP